jgi:hypothetical protein
MSRVRTRHRRMWTKKQYLSKKLPLRSNILEILMLIIIHTLPTYDKIKLNIAFPCTDCIFFVIIPVLQTKLVILLYLTLDILVIKATIEL